MCPENADHATKLVKDKDVGFLASYCATAAYFAEFQKGPSGPFTPERLRRESKMVEDLRAGRVGRCRFPYFAIFRK